MLGRRSMEGLNIAWRWGPCEHVYIMVEACPQLSQPQASIVHELLLVNLTPKNTLEKVSGSALLQLLSRYERLLSNCKYQEYV